MARAQVPFFALNAGEVGTTALARVDLEKMRLAAETMVNFVPTVLGPITIRPGLKYFGSTYNDLTCRLLPFIFNASTTSLIEVTASGLRVRNADSLVTYPNHGSTILGGQFNGVNSTYTRTTSTVTVTSVAHGLLTGASIYCDFTSGGALDGYYTITVTTADAFTLTTVASGAIGTSNLTYYRGWSNQSTTGASVLFGSGNLILNSTEYSYARARHSVTVAGGDQSIRHCVRLDVARGPVIFRIGSTAGGAEIISNQTLDEGVHFISFTPGVATVHLEVEAINEGRAARRVNSIDFYKNADLLIPVPWLEADLNDIRYAQSGSVLFLACDGYQQYKLERRGPNSWGLAKYITSSGPYLGFSARREKLKPNATTGDITVDSDQPYFTSGMVGSIFEITHTRQRPSIIFTGEDQSSDWIRVTGVNAADRAFTLTITYNGTPAGTITLERAFGVPEGWTSYATYTSNQAGITIDDSQASTGPPQVASSNNLIVYYRLTSRPGSGVGAVTVTASLNYQGGTKTGTFRVTGFTSATQVTAEVVKQLGDTAFTEDWREGAWSNAASWPTSVAFHDGRIWWAGLDKVYGSVSDDYYNYDPSTEGDSGPIVRSVATGPVEGIGWMLPLQRLVVGTASAEVSIRSSSFDEPLTPTAFTARNASTVGSSRVQAITIDSTGIFVQRNRSKIFELVYDVEINDYSSREVTRLNQDIGKPGITQLAAQRQPDTRVFFVKDDGTLAMLVYDRADAVSGLCRMETDGKFQSIAILPTGEEDDVYFVVERVINGVTKRYIEKFASSAELQGGEESYLMDSAVKFVSGGGSTSTITGLTHLIGKQVVVYYPRFGGYQNDAFQDDAFQVTDEDAAEPRTTYTVNGSGEITLDFAVQEIIVGMPYKARFKSVKLAYGSQAGTALTQKKRVDHLGLIGVNTAPDGLRIGRDFTNMTKLSSIFKGKALEPFFIVEDWDYDATSFGGKFDTDSRVCIEANSPYPATISGMVIHMQNNDRG
jgi:hypothetical protein